MLRYVALFALFLLVYFASFEPGEKAGSEMPSNPRNPVCSAAAAATPGSAGQEQLGGDQSFLGPGAATAAPAQRALAMRQQIVSTVTADPEGAGQLVKGWLGRKRGDVVKSAGGETSQQPTQGGNPDGAAGR